jgi:hypothetical protein
MLGQCLGSAGAVLGRHSGAVARRTHEIQRGKGLVCSKVAVKCIPVQRATPRSTVLHFANSHTVTFVPILPLPLLSILFDYPAIPPHYWTQILRLRRRFLT